MIPSDGGPQSLGAQADSVVRRSPTPVVDLVSRARLSSRITSCSGDCSLWQFSQRTVLPCVSTSQSAHGLERRNGLRKRRESDAAQTPAQRCGGLTTVILRECESIDVRRRATARAMTQAGPLLAARQRPRSPFPPFLRADCLRSTGAMPVDGIRVRIATVLTKKHGLEAGHDL